MSLVRQHGRNGIPLFLLIFAAAGIPRLALAILLPQISPDGFQYLTVAENIFGNGCISLSDPESGNCVPHWGGNHPPGYPLMIAASWLFSKNVTTALVVQSLLAALAISRLATVMASASERRWVGISVGLVLALSPLHLAWSRFILPETLAVAATIWVAAELIESLRRRSFRTVPVALALIAAFFARYDGVFLVLPVAITGFVVHRPTEALRRGLICAILFSLPIVAWSGRNVAQGLTLIPDPFLQDGGRSPRGYLAWGNTWIVSLYDGAGMAYALQDRDYDRLRINHERAFDSRREERLVLSLIDELAANWNGKPFPEEVDQQFAELAAERRARNPVRHYVLLPLRRAAEFWLNPFYSFAWPLEIDALLDADDRKALASEGLNGALETALKFPLIAGGKAALLAYRVLLILGFIAVLPTALRCRNTLSMAVILCGAYAIFRTTILSYQPSIDSRYIIEAAALLEVGLIAGLARSFALRLSLARS